MAKPYQATAASVADLKFQNLGLDGTEELPALLKLIKVGNPVSRGAEVFHRNTSSKHLTVLLDGTACSCRWLDDGSRQILGFHCRGDFCDLHRYVLPATESALDAIALTRCTIGTIDFKDMDEAIGQYPKLGVALWRASMLEASIYRERLLNLSRRPALQRVAHILCEHLARREVVGIKCGMIPMTQIDLADAAGLSVVHMSRAISELRRLGVLSKKSRAIEVVDKERLVQLAQFDSHYLNIPKTLWNWDVSIEA